MKIFLTTLVFLAFGSVPVQATDFQVDGNPFGIEGRVSIRNTSRLEVEISVTELRSDRSYAVYAHGLGTCSDYDPKLTEVFVKNKKTGVRQRFGRTPNAAFLVDLPAFPGSSHRGAASLNVANEGDMLDTSFSGKVFTLQETLNDGLPSGVVIKCWVHP